MVTRLRAIVAAVALGVCAAGCSVESAKADPPLVGPSEYAMSVSITAAPNELPRDGSSQSVVTISVRDARGRALEGQSLSLSLPVNVPSGATLSSSGVTTDSAGRATFAVVAPSPNSTGNQIVVTARTAGTIDNVMLRQVSIAVTPPNATAPAPSFTVNPASPEIGQAVTFNASATTDESVACLDTCTYAWDFGGEASATGRIVTYTFRAGGTYVVALTVTDAAGATETVRQNVTVGTLSPPSASFTVSPAAPNAGQAATFTATATAATNHRIVNYSWNWGDGATNQTTAPVIQHTFSTTGSYLVVLTVRDDLGQTSETRQVVTVGSGLTASFTNAPAIAGQDTNFDASGSFTGSGASIQLYTWSWGDATADTSTTDQTIEHKFSAAGAFNVTLTVTDSQGRTATLTRTITVAPAP
jgi:PKD repeat protein